MRDFCSVVPTSQVKLRPAGPEDGPAIRSVLESSFPENPKTRADILDWQYWSNPFGAARSWVAEDGGEVVAHYAGIALPGVIDGRPVTLSMGVDAATRPSHRGLGLFEQLARAVYLDGGKAHMPVTYCLPNPNSLRGFQKAGGEDVGRARVLVAPVDDGWLARRFGIPRPVAAAARQAAFRLPAGGAAGMVQSPPDGLDELWAETAVTHGVARHAAWWKWRYSDRPERPYLFVEARRHGRLAGAAAALVRDDLGGRFLCLLELMATDRSAARDVVGCLLRSAHGLLNVDGIAATALSGTAHYRLARAVGLRPLPRRLEPRPMHVGVVDNAGTLPGIAQAPWSLAWGDLDHI